MEFLHKSVLLNESIDALRIKPNGIYVDGTAGGGGHSYQIAKRLQSGRLIAIDQDEQAVRAITERLGCFDFVDIVKANFADIDTVLDSLGISGVDGILLDLGVSSYQLDNSRRGFSYTGEAKLDMRMDQSRELTAFAVVNNYKKEELARILWEYGEERYAKSIAAAIEKARRLSPIQTTTELAEIIKSAIPAKAARAEGQHPAKRSFQAIRIKVNSELDNLKSGLGSCFERLNTGGVLAVISFHSLEDRIVKQTFANYTVGCICSKKLPICVCNHQPEGRLLFKGSVQPSKEEIEANPRSRSARLRAIEKI